MSKIRIAYLAEFESIHGGENSLLTLLPHLIDASVEPVVVAPIAGDFADALRRLGIELVDFERTDQHGKPFSQLQLRDHLAATLRHLSPNLVHANSLAMGRLCGPVVRELQIQSVSHLRDIIRLNHQAVHDLNLHDRLLAVSHATRDVHVAQGIDPEKCHVLYNGVNQTEFQHRPASGFLHKELADSKQPLPHDAILIGNIGQIGLRKGHDCLFDAMREIVMECPNAHLIIIGKRWSSKAESIEYEQRLHDRANQSPLKGHVHFLGVRNDIPAIMNELTLLVHTARQEPLGRVLLEAAASQLPVIATDVGGTSEIFAPLESQHEPSAILVPLDDAHAVAQAAVHLLVGANRCNQLALAARTMAEYRFAISNAVENLLMHYRQILT